MRALGDHRIRRPLERGLTSIWEQDAGGANRPEVLDIDSVCPELRALERSYAVIREELDALLTEHEKIPPYHVLDPVQRGLSDGEQLWRVFLIKGYGIDLSKNQQRCPKTSALLDRIPDVVAAMFSILEPRKSIKPHRGNLFYLRCHLGMRVDRDKPPRFRVGSSWLEWQEGKAFLIDDSHEHEVVNESDEMRVILLVDIKRPMPSLIARITRDLWIDRLIPAVYGRMVGRQLSSADLL